MRRASALALAALTGLALLGACATTGPTGDHSLTTPIHQLSAADLDNGRRLQVIATTSIAADLVAAVAGPDAVVTPLLPLGADPHTFEPTPQDMRAISQADVVLINGLGLEEFLETSLAGAIGSATFVSLSEGIEPRLLADSEDDVHDDEDGENHENDDQDHPGDHDHAIDPHVWLDPLLMIQWTENASAVLSALDPNHAAGYRQRSQEQENALRALHDWITEQVRLIPEEYRLLVTDHDELGYFAERYGFRVVGAVIPSFSTAAEPSAQELAALQRAIQGLGVRAVFVGTTVDPNTVNAIVQDTGIRLVPIYTASLSPPGGPASDYRSMMEYNVAAIAEALR
jgi:ABC-type Zn uptake system ZnuABC Zn-binding protein ZnuA